MGQDRVLGLKVDVDTRRGMEEGVPALLSLLAGFGLRATFFLSFGPDNSGKAVYRMIRNPRFLFKMVRTNAPGLYGFRTALYGTLLKAPMIASAFPALCREIEERGHEVEFHAWDHRAWQDSLPGKGREWIGAWLDNGISAYESCLGHSPRAFGAPGWVLTGTAVEEIARRKWEYLSCTRAPGPFLLGGTGLAEIPSDLPCMEEVGGRKGVGVVVDVLSGGGTHVYPVHAEVEGGLLQDAFIAIIRGALEQGYRIVPLSEIVRELDIAELPRRTFRTSLLRGRAFPCAT
ncbi:MAG: polysaccharide deacetylase family protein [Thermodesulfobacteriota bacterium]|nr:polysaccharide deacetylase family protein [Thermodesulfobacteriota bacterium]